MACMKCLEAPLDSDENSAFSLSQPVLCQHTIPYDLRFSFFFVVSWASPKSLRLSIGQAQHNAFIAQQRTHNTHLYDMKSRKNILRALNKKNINWCRLKAKTNKNYSRQFSLLSRFQQKFFACSLCFLMFLLIFFLSLVEIFIAAMRSHMSLLVLSVCIARVLHVVIWLSE